MFNQLLVTAAKKAPKSNIIIPGVSDSLYSDIQEVITVGPNVAGVSVGDLVLIKIENFMKRGTNTVKQDLVKEYHEVVLPIHEFGEDDYMLISDRDIVYYWEGDLDE